jgi:hypothetical protein
MSGRTLRGPPVSILIIRNLRVHLKTLSSAPESGNSAAHGEVDSLSRERAGLMEQQTNLLLRRLADLLQAAP